MHWLSQVSGDGYAYLNAKVVDGVCQGGTLDTQASFGYQYGYVEARCVCVRRG